MHRIISTWLASILFGLGRGHNTLFEGYDLSLSGYYLCTVNETTAVSRVLSYKTSYTQRRSCGGWLPWSMCEVTLYKTAYRAQVTQTQKQATGCCDGYVQVASYCALPLNRGAEFTAKPGSCPGRGVVAAHQASNCEWDTDCSGWQKCCHAGGFSCCSEPEPPVNRGWCLNVTVTVKMDYQRLVSADGGMLNHTRLLHTVVTGALESPDVSVRHVRSGPAGPFATSSWLLIGSSEPLSLSETSSRLHLLLRRVEEVSGVRVQDVDECAHSELNSCSPHAHCNNTEGSYDCTCRPGFPDQSPNNTGVHCQGNKGLCQTTDVDECAHSELNSCSPHAHCNNTEGSYDCTCRPGFTDQSPNNTGVHCQDVDECAHSELNSCSPHAHCNNTEGSYDCTCRHGFTDQNPNNTGVHCQGSVTLNDWIPSGLPWTSSPGQTGTEPSTSQGPNSTCTPIPQITGLRAFNVTGSTFCLSWAVAQPQSGLAFLVAVRQGPEERGRWESGLPEREVTGLQPGVLYTVAVTPRACGGQGDSVELDVKTAAQMLGATARLTNVEFTEALQNPESQEYKNLSESVQNEILQSLPPDMLVLVSSGQVRVQVTGLSPGSVVVNFSIVFVPGESQDMMGVSRALMVSLQNSSRYAVDNSSTTIQDLDECMLGDVDCSPWAECENTFGSYTCACPDSFTDTNPGRPGRGCTEVLDTTTPTMLTTPSSHMTTALTTTTNSRPIAPATHTYITATTTTPVTTTTTNPVPTTASTTSSTATSTDITTTTAAPASTTTARPVTDTTGAALPTTTTTPATATAALPVAPAATAATTAGPLTSGAEAISVECRAGSITAVVARQFLGDRGVAEASLYLGRPECRVNGANASHVRLTVAWDECGTELQHNSTHNTAQVTLFNNVSCPASPGGSVCAPTARLEVPVLCTYQNSITISTGYSPSWYDMIKDVVQGSGTFHVTVQLLNASSSPLPQNYTLSPDEEVVIEVGVNSTLSQIKVVINRCWATSTSNPEELTNYVFLENSCPVPNAYTAVLQNGNSTRSLLSVRIFSFVQQLSVIYLHCQIQICIETEVASCTRDCNMQRTHRSNNLIGTAKASCGPYHKSQTEVSANERVNAVRTVGFIILGVGLCLLFISGLAGLVYYRKRIGHYNFRFKPKKENFTYHVFDT